MMTMRYSIFLLSSLLLFSCVNEGNKSRTDSFSIDPSTVQYGKDLLVQFTLAGGVDSIRLSLDGQLLSMNIDAKDSYIEAGKLKLGANTLKAELYRKGQYSIIAEELIVYPPAPKQYTFKLVNRFNHDTLAYTQGLEFYKGELYESTGAAEGFVSSIRKVDWETGNVLQRKEYKRSDPTGEPYFLEGLTFVDDKLVLLTYLNGHGFVLYPQTFAEQAKFNYEKSRQGWGLCFDGDKLIKSDGTASLSFLDANSYEEIGTLAIYTDKGIIEELIINEMEYVNGKIYANYYGKDELLIIDPETGVLEGQVNCIGLYRTVAEQNKEMNGIAYKSSSGTFFVTGKQWNQLYEIAIVER